MVKDPDAVAATHIRPCWEPPVIIFMAWLKDEEFKKWRQKLKTENGSQRATRVLDAGDEIRMFTAYLRWLGEHGHGAASLGDIGPERFYGGLFESIRDNYVMVIEVF